MCGPSGLKSFCRASGVHAALRFLYKGIGGDAFRSTVVTEIRDTDSIPTRPRTKVHRTCETLRNHVSTNTPKCPPPPPLADYAHSI